MRSTRSHTGNRRSHHALSVNGISKCVNCGAAQMAHRACSGCGTYNKRDILGLGKKAAKKAKAQKSKEQKK
ncbi:MAG: 50S ribosomal protein L32 [Candidatus Paceibacterota bacterium]